VIDEDAYARLIHRCAPRAQRARDLGNGHFDGITSLGRRISDGHDFYFGNEHVVPKRSVCSGAPKLGRLRWRRCIPVSNAQRRLQGGVVGTKRSLRRSALRREGGVTHG
jgi:hypothetical protein